MRWPSQAVSTPAAAHPTARPARTSTPPYRRSSSHTRDANSRPPPPPSPRDGVGPQHRLEGGEGRGGGGAPPGPEPQQRGAAAVDQPQVHLSPARMAGEDLLEAFDQGRGALGRRQREHDRLDVV